MSLAIEQSIYRLRAAVGAKPEQSLEDVLDMATTKINTGLTLSRSGGGAAQQTITPERKRELLALVGIHPGDETERRHAEAELASADAWRRDQLAWQRDQSQSRGLVPR